MGYHNTNNYNVVLVISHTQLDRSAKGKPCERERWADLPRASPEISAHHQLGEMGMTILAISDGIFPAISHSSAHSSGHEHHKVIVGSAD